MKKLIAMLTLFTLLCLTSCANVGFDSEEMPPTEQEWSDTLQNWYPDWEPPVIVTK